MDLYGYIYLVQPPQYFNTDVYKIGSTKYEGKNRFDGYPKGTRGFIMVGLDNYKLSETELIKLFGEKFKQHYEGREYFKGFCYEMVDTIIDYYRTNRKDMEIDEIGEDISNLIRIFHNVCNEFIRFNYVAYFYSPFLKNLEEKYNISKISYATNIRDGITIFVDKYLTEVEKKFKKSKKTLEVIYFYNLQEAIANSLMHFKDYEDELEKMFGDYNKFLYKKPNHVDIDQYRKQILKCSDIEDHAYYKYYWC